MAFVDREIACMDCSQAFVFTAGEQEFYERKGFKEEPKRCKPCREARKQRRNDTPVSGRPGQPEAAPAGGFGFRGRPDVGAAEDGRGNQAPRASQGDDDDDNIGNRVPAGAPPSAARGPRNSNVRGDADRELHEAPCAQCGAAARVPFRPVAKPTDEPKPSLGDLVDRAVKWLADRLVPEPEPELVPVPIPVRRPPPRRR
jgi:CxxC-x17-CxxC domain-containing protein